MKNLTLLAIVILLFASGCVTPTSDYISGKRHIMQIGTTNYVGIDNGTSSEGGINPAMKALTFKGQINGDVKTSFSGITYYLSNAAGALNNMNIVWESKEFGPDGKTITKLNNLSIEEQGPLTTVWNLFISISRLWSGDKEEQPKAEFNVNDGSSVESGGDNG